MVSQIKSFQTIDGYIVRKLKKFPEKTPPDRLFQHSTLRPLDPGYTRLLEEVFDCSET